MLDIYKTFGWLSFYVTIIISWWILYTMANNMALTIFGTPNAPMDDSAKHMMTSFVPLLGMWVIMMAAMMLPPLVPTLTTYETLINSANATRAGWWGILAGFFTSWLGFAFLITILQLILLKIHILDMMGRATSLWVSAGLTFFVGVYQFTSIKQTCHNICHAPIHYFMRHWNPTGWGGFKMGVGLGIYCIGCCWGFMFLGFAGGVMNLFWMGAATLIIILEKFPQIGTYVTKPVGIIFIGTGFYLIISKIRIYNLFCIQC